MLFSHPKREESEEKKKRKGNYKSHPVIVTSCNNTEVKLSLLYLKQTDGAVLYLYDYPVPKKITCLVLHWLKLSKCMQKCCHSIFCRVSLA